MTPRRRRAHVLVVAACTAACSSSPALPDAGPSTDPRIPYCVTAQSCRLVAPLAFTACVSALEGPPRAVQACIAAAGSDCARARACLYDASHESLCTFGQAPRCEGGVALTCDGQTTTTSETDCALAASGPTCVTSTTQALCAQGTCADPPTRSFCAGSVAARCARPFLLGTDCARLDATCTEPAGDGGVATCTGRGGGCVGTGDCADAHTLSRCLDGHRASAPCRSDERCWPASDTIGHAQCGLGGDCDPGSFYDRCKDGVLTYCRRGRIESVDCRALGFVGCSSGLTSSCITSVYDGGHGPPLTDAFLP